MNADIGVHWYLFIANNYWQSRFKENLLLKHVFSKLSAIWPYISDKMFPVIHLFLISESSPLFKNVCSCKVSSRWCCLGKSASLSMVACRGKYYCSILSVFLFCFFKPLPMILIKSLIFCTIKHCFTDK